MSTPVDNAVENPTLVERIRAIELRWGKEFMEVVVEIHDHLFGVSPPAPVPVATVDTTEPEKKVD